MEPPVVYGVITITNEPILYQGQEHLGYYGHLLPSQLRNSKALIEGMTIQLEWRKCRVSEKEIIVEVGVPITRRTLDDMAVSGRADITGETRRYGSFEIRYQTLTNPVRWRKPSVPTHGSTSIDGSDQCVCYNMLRCYYLQITSSPETNAHTCPRIGVVQTHMYANTH